MSSDLSRTLLEGNEEEIFDTLFSLGGSYDDPGEAVKPLVINLIRSSSEDVCERAVFVAGIRHKWFDAFDVIRAELLKTGADRKYRQFALVRGLGSLSREYGDLKKVGAIALSSVARSDCYDDAVRGVAYNELCAVTEKITPAQYAVAPKSIGQLDVDWEWLSGF